MCDMLQVRILISLVVFVLMASSELEHNRFRAIYASREQVVEAECTYNTFVLNRRIHQHNSSSGSKSINFVCIDSKCIYAMRYND